MELGETLWRAIFFTLVLMLILWLVLRDSSRTGGDRTSAFERLRCVVESETFSEGTLSWVSLGG